MSAPKGGRRQPGMPNLNLSRQQLQKNKAKADPTSPPDTPTTSPHQIRKGQSVFGPAPRSSPMDPRIHPVGNGHQFSYQPFVGPEQLSPRSSSSSEAADESDDDEYSSEEEEEFKPGPFKAPSPRPPAPDAQSLSEEDSESEEESEEEDDEEDEEESEPEQTAAKRAPSPVRRIVQKEEEEEDSDEDEDEDSEEDEDEDEDEDENEEMGEDEDEDGMTRPIMESPVYATVTTTATAVCDFVLEDMDPMDSDNGLSILDPYEIESNRSRSSSKPREDKPPVFEHRELPIRIMQDLKNLNCSNETSDDEEEQDAEETFYKWQQHMRRRRVSLSSSIGKRTFSERSDSDDSDDNGLDVNEVGSSARRMRKRMHRGSLLFQDPPEPRIDELEEPNSSEDEYLTTHQHFGMQLPYWTIEINEMEDSQ